MRFNDVPHQSWETWKNEDKNDESLDRSQDKGEGKQCVCFQNKSKTCIQLKPEENVVENIEV